MLQSNVNEEINSTFHEHQQEILEFISQCLLLRLGENTRDKSMGIRLKYKFISKIKSKIKEIVAFHIADSSNGDNIYNSSISTGGDCNNFSCDNTNSSKSLPVLFDKILESKEYAHLVQMLNKDLELTCNEILNNLQKKRIEKEFLISESSLDSRISWSIGSLASGYCPTALDLKSILTKINHKNCLESRKSALKQMKSYSVGDLISEEYWNDSKLILESTTIDEDYEICLVGLQLYGRAFSIAPNYLLPEIFNSLCKILQLTETPALVSSNIQSAELSLKKYRLLHQFMMKIPQVWSRYSDQVIGDLIQSLVSLLLLKQEMPPLQCLALVDPTATWFEKWTLGQLGRQKLVKYLSKSGFIDKIICIFKTLEINMNNPESQESITRDLEMVFYSHISAILNHLFCCKVGRQELLICNPTINLDQFITTLVKNVRLNCESKLLHQEICFAEEQLVKLINSAHFVLKQEFVQLMLEPLQQTLENSSDIQNDLFMATSANILAQISNSHKIRNFLVNVTVSFNDKPKKVLEIVASFIDEFGIYKDMRVSNTLKSILKLFCELAVSGEAIMQLSKLNIPKLILAYKESEDDTKLDAEYLDLLANFMLNPFGTLILNQAGLLECSIQNLIQKFNFNQCLIYNRMLGQLLNSRLASNLLWKTGFINSQFDKLFDNLLLDQPTGPQELDLDDVQLQAGIMFVSKLLISWDVWATKVEFPKYSSILDTLLEPSNDIDVQFIKSTILRYITNSLDFRIFISVNYNYKQVLLDWFDTTFMLPVDKSMTFVVDQNSIICNYLLIDLVTIGGPNERNLPPLSMDLEYDTMIYNGEIGESTLPILNYEKSHSFDFEGLAELSDLSSIHNVAMQTIQNDQLDIKSMKAILDKLILGKEPASEFTNGEIQISDEIELAIAFSYNYGKRLLPNVNFTEFRTKFTELIKKLPTFSREKSGFDWFAATIFIVYWGADAYSIMQWYAQNSMIWHQLQSEQDEIIYIYQKIETIVELEYPRIYSAFALSGYTITEMTTRWLRQVFWNILDFPQILGYILLSTKSPSYQVYFVVVVIASIESELLRASNDNKIFTVMNEHKLLKGFKIKDWIEVVDNLKMKYSYLK